MRGTKTLAASAPPRARGRLLLLPAAVLLGAPVVALFAPPFRVDDIRAEGAGPVLRAEAEVRAKAFVRQHATLRGHPRLFLVRRDELARDLLAHLPVLASVRVIRRLPAMIELSLQEKVPVAFLETAGKTFSLDGTGRIIAEVSPEEAAAADLPSIRDSHSVSSLGPGDAVLSAPVMPFLHEAVLKLPEQFSVTVEALTVPAIGSEEIHVRTTGGWDLLLDTRRPLAEQLEALEKVVTEELAVEELRRLEYIDLRVPGKVFYQLRRGNAPPPA